MDAATTSVDPGRGSWRLRLPERLPDLKGKWLTLYTIVWAIMNGMTPLTSRPIIRRRA